MGWMIPIPPASDTAATSSGLLQGYIAPQMTGTSIPAWRASGVSSREGLIPARGASAPWARATTSPAVSVMSAVTS
jgi:hypothetical protein